MRRILGNDLCDRFSMPEDANRFTLFDRVQHFRSMLPEFCEVNRLHLAGLHGQIVHYCTMMSDCLSVAQKPRPDLTER